MGTLCYRHGYKLGGCDECGQLWSAMAQTATPAWATKVIWPQLGSLSPTEAARQHQALEDGRIVYGW